MKKLFVLQWSKIVAVVLVIFSASIRAQPSTPINIIVPFNPGGSADRMARVLATNLNHSTGRPVIVTNAAGGNSGVALDRLLTAPRDGNTLLLTYGIGAVAVDGLPPVALLAKGGVGIYSTAGKTMTSLAGKRASHPGFGSIPHQVALALQQSAGLGELIAYRGNAPAITDLNAGQVDVYIGIALTPEATAGSGLKALAVSDAELAKNLGVSNFASAGFASASASVWYGTFTTPGVSKAQINEMQSSLLQAANSASVAQVAKELGLVHAPANSDQLQQLVTAGKTYLKDPEVILAMQPNASRQLSQGTASPTVRDASPTLGSVTQAPISQGTQTYQRPAGTTIPNTERVEKSPSLKAGSFNPPRGANDCVNEIQEGDRTYLGNRCSESIKIVSKYVYSERPADGYRYNLERREVPSNHDRSQTLNYPVPVKHYYTSCYSKDANCKISWLTLLQHCKKWHVTNMPAVDARKIGGYSGWHGPLARVDVYGMPIDQSSVAKRKTINSPMLDADLSTELHSAYAQFLEEALRNRQDSDQGAVACTLDIYPRMVTRMNRAYLDVANKYGLKLVPHPFSD